VTQVFQQIILWGGKKLFVEDYSVQREKKKERKETII
jgi:hypothetical protein